MEKVRGEVEEERMMLREGEVERKMRKSGRKGSEEYKGEDGKSLLLVPLTCAWVRGNERGGISPFFPLCAHMRA